MPASFLFPRALQWAAFGQDCQIVVDSVRDSATLFSIPFSLLIKLLRHMVCAAILNPPLVTTFDFAAAVLASFSIVHFINVRICSSGSSYRVCTLNVRHSFFQTGNLFSTRLSHNHLHRLLVHALFSVLRQYHVFEFLRCYWTEFISTAFSMHVSCARPNAPRSVF